MDEVGEGGGDGMEESEAKRGFGEGWVSGEVGEGGWESLESGDDGGPASGESGLGMSAGERGRDERAGARQRVVVIGGLFDHFICGSKERESG